MEVAVRRRDAKFFGFHACRAVAARRPEAVQRAYVTEATLPAFADLLQDLARRRRPYRVVAAAELAKVAGSKHHEGVCLVADPPPAPEPGALFAELARRPAARLLYLDGVSNPHNVGALLRTAAHFRVGALLGPAEALPSAAGGTARVAEGGAERVPIVRFRHPARSLERLAAAGFCRVATVVAEGEPAWAAELPAHCVLLLGAERAGLRQTTRALADRVVTIPGSGAVESLNVGAAAAVLLAEHARRHGT